jgi:hypothetical protein
LYTREAWRTFLGSLTERGLISVSRWYVPPEPHEIYKTVALATAALRDIGITDTRRHIAVIAQLHKQKGLEALPGVGTLLVRRTPFTEGELATLARVAEEMDFDVVLSPRSEALPMFASVADSLRLDATLADAPLNLIPPVDDRPFFFRMDDRMVSGLLAFVVAIAAALIVVPVLVKADLAAVVREGWLSVAFAAFGAGFMLIEISLMMRLTLLLGHPTFSLSVVLFGMLLACGAGSASTTRLGAAPGREAVTWRLATLVAVLVLLGVATPFVVDALHTATTPVRIAAALGLLLPGGFFMGMVFPIGMAIASGREPRLGAWLWGINGAASVCATVLTVAIASRWGIAAAWWSGTACYLAAAAIISAAAAGARTR